MNKRKDYIELDVYKLFSMLWHKIWIILLCAILGGGSFFLTAAYAIQPMYTADATLYVNNNSLAVDDTKLSISQGDLTAAQSLIETYGVILKSRTTLNEVIEQSGLNYTYDELVKMISSEAINATELFHVEVTCASPEDAELLANTIAKVLPEKISAIVDGSSVRVVDNAVTPAQQSSPNVVLDTVLGTLLGGFLACAVIVIRELKDDQIRGTDYVIQNYEKPVLAVIPDLKSKNSTDKYGGGYYAKSSYESASRKNQKQGHGRQTVNDTRNDINVLGDNLNFAASEAYKLLRTNLEFCVPQNDRCQIIGVTSAMRGEGKTTTSINTAYTIAQTGKKVLLLEADMRLPNIARRLGLRRNPGLSNTLSSGHVPQEFLQQSKLVGDFWVITSGDCPPNPAELLGSEKMSHLVQELMKHFDVIIMDLPPLGIVTDALTASKLLDGVVVVVRERMCTRKGLADVVNKLNFVSAKVLGFVLTGSNVAEKSYKYKKSSSDNGYCRSHERAKK